MKFACIFLGVAVGFGFLREQKITIQADDRKQAIEKFQKLLPHAILLIITEEH